VAKRLIEPPCILKGDEDMPKSKVGRPGLECPSEPRKMSEKIEVHLVCADQEDNARLLDTVATTIEAPCAGRVEGLGEPDELLPKSDELC